MLLTLRAFSDLKIGTKHENSTRIHTSQHTSNCNSPYKIYNLITEIAELVNKLSSRGRHNDKALCLLRRMQSSAAIFSRNAKQESRAARVL